MATFRFQEVLAEAEALAPELEAARDASRLPRRPDVARADALLRRTAKIARRRRSGPTEIWQGRAAGAGGHVERVNRSFGLSEHQRAIGDRVQARKKTPKREHLVIYLSGAHAYGFPSPDSDLDLAHLTSPRRARSGLRA
ncbi:MAG: nucleotidyltransferase domain-containing protein [Labilithrix sp.]